MDSFSLSEKEANDSHVDEVSQDKARSKARRWFVAVGCAIILACFVAAYVQHGHRPLRSGGSDLIELVGQRKTKFGSVPNKLTLSGLACPGGWNGVLNGDYVWKGTTPDGRSWYRGGSRRRREGAVMYYDRECDGSRRGADNGWGAWFVAFPDDFNPNKHEAINVGQSCATAIRLFAEPSDKDHIWRHGGKNHAGTSHVAALGVPPQDDEWYTWCGNKHGHIYQAIHIEGGAQTLTAQGSWKYLYTAVPGEKVTITSGLTTTKEVQNTVGLGAEISMTMSGEVGLKIFGPSAKTEVSTTLSSNFERVWSDSATRTSEQTREFELPSDGGYHALFQWQFALEDSAGNKGATMTSDFAFTPGLSKPPKCAPGMCKQGDCPHYEECVPGYYL